MLNIRQENDRSGENKIRKCYKRRTNGQMSELSFTVHATKHIARIERASATVTRIVGELDA